EIRLGASIDVSNPEVFKPAGTSARASAAEGSLTSNQCDPRSAQMSGQSFQLVALDGARLVEAEQRHAPGDGEGQPGGDGNQFVTVPRQHEPGLGQRADQHFQHQRVELVAGILLRLVHQLSGAALVRAISYSVMAISVSARASSEGASSRTCFSAAP